MKNITIVRADSGQYDDLAILPGTTSQDVLEQIGLNDDFVISPGRGQEPIGKDENLYQLVPEGAKFWVGLRKCREKLRFIHLNRSIAHLPGPRQRGVCLTPQSGV